MYNIHKKHHNKIKTYPASVPNTLNMSNFTQVFTRAEIIQYMRLANLRWRYAISHWLGIYTEWSQQGTFHIVWHYNGYNNTSL